MTPAKTPLASGRRRRQRSSSGQLSLEFTLLLAAFFSFLLVLLPAMQQALELGTEGIDLKAASLFLDRAKNVAERLNAFGEGSSETVEGFALHDWRFSATGKNLLQVELGETANPKTLTAELPVEIMLAERTVNGKFALRLTRVPQGLDASVDAVDASVEVDDQ